MFWLLWSVCLSVLLAESNSQPVNLLPLQPQYSLHTLQTLILETIPTTQQSVTDHRCQWTIWFDIDHSTGEGDFELLSTLLETNREKVCDDPQDIEGRVKGTEINALNSGQTIEISPQIGLICRNKGQTCRNYEVRFCCSTRPRCVNGEWTPHYYSVDTPGDNGDFEYLSTIRMQYPDVCENPSAIDARRINDGVHYTAVHGIRGRIVRQGQQVIGFECRNHILTPAFPIKTQLLSLFPIRCDDYEVKLCCPKTVEPPCAPEDWSPWFDRDDPNDGDNCDNERLELIRQEYPGIIKCENPTAIDARLKETGERYDRTAVNIMADVFHGFRCCNRFGHRCGDYEVRFCCPSVSVDPPSCDGEWTSFFDRDNPSGYGDYETLADLRTEHDGKICKNPTVVDARLVGTDTHHPIAGQTAHADLQLGFYCVNSEQMNKPCLDYEARFCCPKEQPCDEADWSDFYSVDTPYTGEGDVEDLETVASQKDDVCINPSEIDVRLLNGAHYSSLNQEVHISLTDGFSCLNNEQSPGEICCDYKARYCCPDAPPSCDKCLEWNGEWTDFFNVDTPFPINKDDNCDCEFLDTIRRKYREVCNFPIDIDIRLASNDQDFTTAGQDVDFSLIGGFRCVNENQRCEDYKVRFCCLKEEEPIGELSWCSASGDPHYTSFDGRRFDFQGTCTYVFAQTTEEAQTWHLHPFKIAVENENRGNPTVSWLKKIFVEIDDVNIELGMGLVVLVNGINTVLPYSDNFYGFTIVLDGARLRLETVFGLVIIYDGNHLIEVGVPSNYEEHVEGLCGNFNGDQDDDFIISGTAEVVDDVNEFGESYKTDDSCVSDPDEVEPCDANQQNQFVPQCERSILAAYPCLRNCSKEISIVPFLENCVYDACATDDVETAAAQSADAYVEECIRRGFHCILSPISSGPPSCDGVWTRYFDHDNPSGVGDFEFPQYGREICERPSAIDARVVGTNDHHPIDGQVAHVELDRGFHCVNREQINGQFCLDYEVRFCCPGDVSP